LYDGCYSKVSNEEDVPYQLGGATNVMSDITPGATTAEYYFAGRQSYIA